MMRLLPDKSATKFTVKRLIGLLHVGPTLSTAFPNLLSIPVALICLPYLLAQVDAALFGTVIFITLIVNQSQVILFGLDKSTTYIISSTSNTAENDSEIYSVALLLAISLGISIAAILNSVALSGVIGLTELQMKSILLITIGVFCHLLWSIQRAYLISQERFSTLGFLNFLHLSSALFLPALSSAFFSHSNSVLILLLPYFFFRLFLLVILSRQMPSFRILNAKTFISKLKSLLDQGKWMGTGNLVNQFFEGLDRYVLTLFGPISLMPSYHIPLQLSQKLAVFPQALSTVIFSKLSKGRDLTRELLAVISAFLVLLSSLFMILNEPILVLWLGHHIQPEITLISAITFTAMAFASLNFIILSTAEASGFAKQVAKIDLAALIPATLLAFTMIYFFSIIGAAISLLLREMVLFFVRLILTSIFFSRKREIILCTFLLLVFLTLETYAYYL